MTAIHMGELGWKQCDIASALDVTNAAVSQWFSTMRESGSEALHSKPRSGRPPKLTVEQQRRIPDILWHGPEAYGFRGQVWNCPRIAQVLQEELDVSYTRSQVSRLLKRLGWTPQAPIVQAIQQDEEEIERWRRKVWPELRERARQEYRTLFFVDESGFYLLPGVVKTYAPRGSTPRLLELRTREHLSVMAGITAGGKVYSLARQESLNGLHTVAFLTHLLRMVEGRLLVVWDGSPIHHRAEVKEFLEQGMGRRIHIEPLPFYAPELNPVEWMWQHLKNVEMCNVTCLDVEELHMEFHLALGRVRQKPQLISSFFTGAGLTI